MRFLSLKKTHDKKRYILHIAFKENRLSDQASKDAGLFGVRPTDLYDLLRAGMQVFFNMEPEDGPAPAGSIERKIAVILKKKSGGA